MVLKRLLKRNRKKLQRWPREETSRCKSRRRKLARNSLLLSMKVGFSFEMGYTAMLAVPWSSSSSCHYSWTKLVSTAQNWVGFPSPDQLSYDNHHSLRVFIHWHQVRRLSIIAFFLSRGTFSKIAKYHGGHLRRHCWASYWELLRPRGKAHF